MSVVVLLSGIVLGFVAKQDSWRLSTATSTAGSRECKARAAGNLKKRHHWR